MVKSALLASTVLIGVFGLAFAIFLYANAIPATSIELASVAKDTSFYVGANHSQRGTGSTISIRAVGQLDDSTAYVLVTYPDDIDDTLVPIRGPLKKDQIDQLWVSDFYNRRAKITFLHKSVQHGHLRLQVNFSYPPNSWGYQQTNRGWVKAK